MTEEQDSDGAVGDTFDYKGLSYTILSETATSKTVAVTSGQSATGSITIPVTAFDEKGDAYTVTSIGIEAFNGCFDLTSMTLPESVTTIGDGAFKWCSQLSFITINGKISSIGVGAFQECTNLTKIEFKGSSVSLGNSAFRNCEKLETVTITRTGGAIGDAAFCGCTALESIYLPNSTSSIGYEAFYGCTALESIYLPDSVKTLKARAFSDCTGLQSIRFGKEMTDMAENAFNKQTFYDETGTTAFNPNTQVGELQGRLFKADGTETSKMIRQPQYKLTFDCGESPAKEVMYNEGDRIAKPDDPEKAGYSFMYWAKDGKEFDFAAETMPAEDMTLTAVWEVNQYTISFNSDGGSAVDPITQDYGTLVEKPADPTKEGYSFLYWAKDGKEYTFGTMPAEDIVLKAVWEAHVFTVTFVTGTGTEIAYERAYGSSMTLPGEGGEISKTGYTLSGWQISGQGDVFGPGTEYVVTSDVTFTAVWKTVPSWDDDDPYVPVPDSDAGSKNSNAAGSGTSVAAVAIAAGCAAALLIMLAMLGNGRSRN